MERRRLRDDRLVGLRGAGEHEHRAFVGGARVDQWIGIAGRPSALDGQRCRHAHRPFDVERAVGGHRHRLVEVTDDHDARVGDLVGELSGGRVTEHEPRHDEQDRTEHHVAGQKWRNRANATSENASVATRLETAAAKTAPRRVRTPVGRPATYAVKP
jgi:hypothetical protein